MFFKNSYHLMMRRERLELDHSLSIIMPSPEVRYYDLVFDGFEEIILLRVGRLNVANSLEEIVRLPYYFPEERKSVSVFDETIDVQLDEFIYSLTKATKPGLPHAARPALDSIDHKFKLNWVLNFTDFDFLALEECHVENTLIIRNAISSFSLPEALTTLSMLSELRAAMIKTNHPKLYF